MGQWKTVHPNEVVSKLVHLEVKNCSRTKRGVFTVLFALSWKIFDASLMKILTV